MRYKATSEGLIPFTDEENAQYDAEEALWETQKKEILADGVRKERDIKIAASDWRVIKAAETGLQISAEWAAYRQALRDVPAQSGFPENVVWPQPPA